MGITPEQCRAARGLLNWSQRELVERSGVSQKAIADFERGVSTPYMRTLKDIVAAFEAAGVQFIAAQEPATGIGVAFRWGVEPIGDATDKAGDEATGKPGEGIDARSWDEDFSDLPPVPAPLPDLPPMTEAEREEMRQYYRDNPERWARISPIGKACLARTMGLNDSSVAP